MNRWVGICLLFLCSVHAIAQSSIPALERTVSIDVNNETISTILQSIAAQTHVKFSYSPTVIPSQQKTTFRCNKKPIRVVLSLLFKDEINWKQKGDFIILTPKPAVKTKAQKHVTISGYVYTAGGDKLSTVSIVSEGTRSAAVTNQYGYFTLDVSPEQLPLAVKIVKENYPDTTIHLTKENTMVDVSLPPKADSTKTDSSLFRKQLVSTGKFFGQLFVNDATQSTMRNFKDTLFTKVQFSFIPYISTNKLLSGNTINDVSINILAGYSQGIRVAEIGGLFNIDRGDVKSFQAAGLCNLVSGNNSGAQLAGIANINGGRVDGMRAAGLVNIGHHIKGTQLAGWFNINANFRDGFCNYKSLTNDTVIGVQAAGFANMNSGYANGVRLGGLYNIGNTMNGVQVAGLFNTQIGYFHGVQVAGLFNATRDTSSGVQVAGLFNVNGRSANHVSIAGLANFNLAQTRGLQLTSIVNYTRSLKGVQIALLNFSDSCEGTPIGLINFAAKGYHKVEVFGDEVLYTQLALRTGVLHLHNIFIAGVDMTRRVDALWSLGYGLGSYKRLNEKWLFGTDVTVQLLIQNEPITDASATMGAVFVALERTYSQKFSIAFGPSFKFFHGREGLSNILAPYSVLPISDGLNAFKMWAGAKVSFRFF
ncbi:MAG: hypothetical protein V4590_05100 [Bacteroidota bacterium]